MRGRMGLQVFDAEPVIDRIVAEAVKNESGKLPLQNAPVILPGVFQNAVMEAAIFSVSMMIDFDISFLPPLI